MPTEVTDATFWTEFSKQAPGIVGVIAVTFMFLFWGVKPFLEYLREQTKLWMEFLKEQRELSNLELGKIGIEVKGLTSVVIELKTLFVQHDLWEREAAGKTREEIQDVKGLLLQHDTISQASSNSTQKSLQSLNRKRSNKTGQDA